MASSFPTSLQDLDATRGAAGQALSSPNHITHHALEDDTIEALQAKVGADSSAVTTTHDYKLNEVTGTDKAVGKTASQTLTNKTLTSPTLTTPTIASFANATHTHQDAAGGGQLVATSIFASGTVPTARLGSGAAGATTFLRGDQTWAIPVVTVATGNTTQDISSTTSNVIAHGLGVAPSFVEIEFFMADDASAQPGAVISFAKALYSGSGTTYQAVAIQSGNSTNDAYSTHTAQALIYKALSATSNTQATITVDATNITIAWQKGGTPTGTINIAWKAFR